MSKKTGSAWLALISFIILPTPGQATSEGLTSAEYGSLYVLEQKESTIPPWKLSGGYSFESGNPYQQVYGLSVTFERALGRFNWVGIQVTHFITSQTQLMNTLQNSLEAQNISSIPHNPKFGLFGIFTAIPLSGHMNFFGNKPFQTELHVRLGAGKLAYSHENSRFGILWSVRPTLYATPRISTQLGIGQEFESPFHPHDRISRLKGEFCIGYQL